MLIFMMKDEDTYIRTYLRTNKELEKAKKETEHCERCGAPENSAFINCGKDCIYHEEREDEQHKIEKGLKPCRCTCEEKAGKIENRIYCSYKKRPYETDIDIEDIEF